MQTDKNSISNKGYWIRNVYFDSMDDEGYADKLAGVKHREKYRLRLYNFSSETIKFEIKRKADSFVKKDSFLIDKQETESLLQGDYKRFLESESKILNILYPIFTTRLYKPKIQIDYMREAYTLPYNNIRITFDKYVSSSSNYKFFKKDNLQKFPRIQKGKVILEVKFNNFLPGYIKNILRIDNIERSAISKYTIGREAFYLSTKTI